MADTSDPMVSLRHHARSAGTETVVHVADLRAWQTQIERLVRCVKQADDVVGIWLHADLDADAVLAAMSEACDAYTLARDEVDQILGESPT